MANFFEQFDAPAKGNFFAQFDAPAEREPAPNAGRSRPEMGGLEAAGRGAASALSLGFGDELAGLWNASGIPKLLSGLDPATRQSVVSSMLGPLAGVAAGGAAGAGAARLLTGDAGATGSYEEGRDAVRAALEQAREDQPGATLAGEIAGGIALPLGGLLRGATLPARAVRGSAVGVGVGGVSGAGQGETPAERAVGSAAGAGVGGLVGAAAPLAVEGVVRGSSALASPIINQARAALNPQNAAERAVGRAYVEAQRADPNAVNRLTPGDLAPGGPAVAMDVLGQPGRNLARSAGNLSGEARDVLNQALDPRVEQQVPRLAGWLRQTFHYPDAHAQQEAIDQTSKAVNNRLYAAARQAGDHQIWSPELERLTGAPEVVEAMKKAAATGKGRAVLEGGGGFNAGVTVDNGGIVTFQKGPTGQPTYPNLQFWDYARRELSDAAKKATPGTEEAGRLKGLAKLMNDELDILVPEYRTARQTAASFFGAENALEAGQKFVTENFAIPQTRQALARMSQQERQLFQDGFVSRYVETLGSLPDRADVVRRIYNTPNARAKIELVLGQQRARELEAMLRVENIMQQSLRGVQGNSTTAMQIIGAGLAGAGGGGWLGFDPTASGAAAALATAGKKGIDQRVATRVAQLLISDDPAVLRRGVSMIAGNQRLMDVLRSLDAGAARVGSQQASNVGGLQAGSVGRAEEDQP